MLFAALLIAGGGVAGAAGPPVSVPLSLPAPSGPDRVGATRLHLVDAARKDPWRPDTVRELMATVFYPARSARGYPVMPQLTAKEGKLFGETAVIPHPELPPNEDWAATMTHSHLGAPVAAGRHPVLLYTPGLGDPRTVNSGLAEELASRGYVVVAMDHPGETFAVEFPDGHVRGFEIPGDPGRTPELYRKAIETRLADVRFVLGQVTALAAGRNPDAERRPLPSGLTRALDPRRIGVFGHSGGGAAASEAMHENPAIDAAVNLEGFLDYIEGDPLPIAAEGTRRPLLLFGTADYQKAYPRFERSWQAVLAKSPCQVGKSILGDASHWALTDFASMVPQLQAAGLMTEQGRDAFVGAIDPAVSVPAVRAAVVAFFDRHVRRSAS
ncbi:alpha/beta hydrolase [Amycolatopsis minnesotensis]|uniref:alpha/beta hydrolase family protein n=1 Tax=Amycolatopsis minnesotensis TaxID=337894 RepID=UPI0031D7A3B9